MMRGPMPASELEAIATESSQTERRADDAERELIEWKKIKFMQDRVGEEFDGIVLSCTKYGFFVELNELFIEGLVPIASLGGFGARDYRDEDRYVFRDTDRHDCRAEEWACVSNGHAGARAAGPNRSATETVTICACWGAGGGGDRAWNRISARDEKAEDCGG